MKNLVLLITILLIIPESKAQDFDWVRSMGGPGTDVGYSICSDAQENLYTTGIFRDSTDFSSGAGTSYLVSNGQYDLFITKHDINGNLKWAKSIGGTATDWGWSIAYDGNKYLYLTGRFTDSVDFDPGIAEHYLVGTGYSEIYILKLDTAGNFIWAKSMGGPNAEQAFSLSLDQDNNIYISGFFQDSVDFDPGPGIAELYNSNGDPNNSDAFIAKYDSSGNYLWARAFGGSGYDAAFSISVDDVGNVFSVGPFSDTIDIDPGPGSKILISDVSNAVGNSEFDSFILRMDNQGNLVWAESIADGSAECYAWSIVTDNRNAVYFTGIFAGSCVFTWSTSCADFDPDPNVDYIVNSRNGNPDLFVGKYDYSGDFKWAGAMGALGWDDARTIALDSDYNIYTSGEIPDEAEMDPNPSNSIYIQTGNGDNACYISKLDSNGNYQGALAVQGQSSDAYSRSRLIHVTPDNHLVVTGGYRGTVDFDYSSSNTNTSSSTQAFDIFIAKYQLCIPAIDVSITRDNDTLIANSTVGTYQWFDCNTNTIFPGETNREFVVPGEGDYAVTISTSNCTRNSSCVNINYVGVENDLDQFNSIKVYPVPAFEKIFLQGNIKSLKNLKIYNIQGDLIMNHESYSAELGIDISRLNRGIYFIEINRLSGIRVKKKFIKN